MELYLSDQIKEFGLLESDRKVFQNMLPTPQPTRGHAVSATVAAVVLAVVLLLRKAK